MRDLQETKENNDILYALAVYNPPMASNIEQKRGWHLDGQAMCVI